MWCDPETAGEQASELAKTKEGISPPRMRADLGKAAAAGAHLQGPSSLSR